MTEKKTSYSPKKISSPKKRYGTIVLILDGGGCIYNANGANVRSRKLNVKGLSIGEKVELK